MKEYIYENNLKQGMIFSDIKQAVKHLGYTYISHAYWDRERLRHYCDYIENEDGTVEICQVFPRIKPFKAKNEFKYFAGDVIYTKTGGFIIDKPFYEYKYSNCLKKWVKEKYYVCRCLIDGCEFIKGEASINRNKSCPVCANRSVVSGINDLKTTHPQYVKYFKDANYPLTHTYASNIETIIKCPNCGSEKLMTANSLTSGHYQCDMCSDGISYPNKFIRNFLSQLSINFEPEKSFRWSEKKIYDQYLPDYNCIIENHGRQHYDAKMAFKNRKRKEKENDDLKRNLAYNNGIKNYIELDCSESTMEYIKNSIMDSELPTLFYFTDKDIDWNLCNQSGYKNIVPKVWDFWNQTNDYYKTLKKFSLSATTLRRYIDLGITLKKCTVPFFLNEDTDKRKYKKAPYNARPIYCIDDDTYYAYAGVCAEYKFKDKSKGPSIGRAANKGITFKGESYVYITREKFNKIKDDSYKHPNIKIVGEKFTDVS